MAPITVQTDLMPESAAGEIGGEDDDHQDLGELAELELGTGR